MFATRLPDVSDTGRTYSDDTINTIETKKHLHPVLVLYLPDKVNCKKSSHAFVKYETNRKKEPVTPLFTIFTPLLPPPT